MPNTAQSLQMSARLASALDLAAQGFRVFPLAAGSNKPPKGFFRFQEQATVDPAQIRAWWKTNPDFNVGVATGQGLVVVDVDVKKGKPGAESLETLEIKGLPLDGYRVKTPTGGLHVFLKTTHGHRQIIDALEGYPGIDIKCEGNYVVGAGSVRREFPDAPYVGYNGTALPDAPKWLDDLIIKSTPRRQEKTEQPIVELDKPSNVASAVEYLKNRAPEAIEGAGGNTTTYRVAARMRDYGLSDGKAWELMLDHWNERKASPTWDAEELLRVVQNAYAYATGAWGGEDMSAYFEEVEGIEDERPADADSDKQAAGHGLRVISVAELSGLPIPPRGWFVPDLIPSENVTLLYGDGGTGKSQIALQLAAATALGQPWLGLAVASGPSLFLSAEDDIHELHRRTAAILDSYDRSFEDAAQLHLVSLAGEDALLASPEGGRSNILKPTARYRDLNRAIETIKPGFVVLDTLADLFGGDEIQRSQARQFIGLIRQLCLHHSTTVLLLAHPSLSGLSSGTGSSGSTGWSNSVRSRLYFRRVKEDQVEANPDLRVLETQKANYGPVGRQLELRWHRGVFVRHGSGDPLANAAAGEARAEEIFLDLLDENTAAGRTVSGNKASNFAPAVFAGSPNAAGLTKAALKSAMERLFASGKVRSVEFGPQSRRRNKLVRVGESA